MPTAETVSKPESSHLIGELTLKRIAIVAALMLGAYLVGFVPGWLASNGLETEIARLQRINSAHTLKSELATASLHAGQGRYEEAIAAAGNFFDRLRREVDTAGGNLDNERARETAMNMLVRRDEVVAMLARGDAAAETVLAGWYFELDTLTNGVK